eukprot:TRINITY_DN4223_c0_g1_i1.p1 TRINITY_DN4223_c0_g1~~TRINITY_DN4223_c0_g1_i1.p1  ORF type:complete len:122 (-),score=20.21 TRINITY_DN4223_c0_g1_i1:285-650(-)
MASLQLKPTFGLLSSEFSGTTVPSIRGSATAARVVRRPLRCLAVNNETTGPETSRRSLVAIVGVTLTAALVQPGSALAAGRKKPEEKKKEKVDLGGYDLKAYESRKRKEELKAKLAALKGQ